MPDLSDAIRQFDATEANLKRLEGLWEEIESLIPPGTLSDTSGPDAVRYAGLCRTFRHFLREMPKLDGFELQDVLQDIDAISSIRHEVMLSDDPLNEDRAERSFSCQGEILSEYRFRFAAQRRALVRRTLEDAIKEVDAVLSIVGSRDFADPILKVTKPEWESLKRLIAQIDVLRGTAIKTPDRWSDLHRHLGFGMTCDVHDIIKHDWPAAKESLQAAMYGPDDPVPVETADLTTLVNAAPTGPVVTAFQWEAIDAEHFERLVYNLVSDAPGYSNVRWLTRTEAPDRGRDISATKTIDDALSGTRVLRVMLQCKHWLNRSIGMEEVSKLANQMSLWEPPKVDELVIVTTGRFSSDAVDWIERHNNDRKTPLITMWPDSHLESLLAARPHLVAQFRLR